MREPDKAAGSQADNLNLIAIVARGPMTSVEAGVGVPCTYCRQSIALSAFAFRSSIHQLISGRCPHCDKRVTVKTPRNARVISDWTCLP
jgi:hypothetical protein